jgi:hypothetical protein
MLWKDEMWPWVSWNSISSTEVLCPVAAVVGVLGEAKAPVVSHGKCLPDLFQSNETHILLVV